VLSIYLQGEKMCHEISFFHYRLVIFFLLYVLLIIFRVFFVNIYVTYTFSFNVWQPQIY